MTTQTDYTADEWDLIVQAPTLASLFVILAQQYRPTAVARKMFAALAAIIETAQNGSSTELIQAVAVAIRAGQAPWWPTASPSDLVAVHAWALERCHQVALLLAQTTPETETAAFTRWLIAIGERAALVPDLPGLPDQVPAAEALPPVRRALDTLAAVLTLPDSVGADPPDA
ncbi:MAG: hypothetical protein HGA45_17305 [Chloroflexales bacterium]|nr:hypothetical protein [Chloroflexales bacterium]